MCESLEQTSSEASVGIAGMPLPGGKDWDATPDQSTPQRPAPLTAAERRALVEKPFPPIGSIRVVGSRYHHAGTEVGQVVPHGADDIDAVIISIDRKRHRGRKPSMSDYEDR